MKFLFNHIYKSIILLYIIYVIGLSKEVLCQNIVTDFVVNPIPNLVFDFSDKYKDLKVFSGVLEIGEPYLALSNAKYKPSNCLIFDYAAIDENSAFVIRLGRKRYWGTKEKFYLRGQSVMPSFGGIFIKSPEKSYWGLVAGITVGYKFLIIKRLIIEPFFQSDFAYSKFFFKNFYDKYTLGMNIGLRLTKPDY
jgi:hypothetical protein